MTKEHLELIEKFSPNFAQLGYLKETKELLTEFTKQILSINSSSIESRNVMSNEEKEKKCKCKPEWLFEIFETHECSKCGRQYCK